MGDREEKTRKAGKVERKLKGARKEGRNKTISSNVGRKE